MNKPRLYIGNCNYSSWSLRPWLCLRWAGIEFDETQISLAQAGYGKEGIAEVAAVSPNRRVPAVHVEGHVIWDSLAIIEWAAEARPDANLWPKDWRKRALARSAVCEMHSGFPDLRNDLPTNINRRCQVQSWSEATQRDINRIIEIWTQLRYGNEGLGPWLCGERGIVDAFFAPVMTRFRTYGVKIPAEHQCTVESVFSDPDFLQWEARPVTDGFAFIDDLYPYASPVRT
jgi:glutathione S-transferase